jgi:hypothetical protein
MEQYHRTFKSEGPASHSEESLDIKSRNKVLAQLFLILLFCLFIGATIYAILGERIITDLYSGRLPFTSMTVLSSEPDRPLDYYLMRADIIIWQFIVIGLPVTFLIWALLIKVSWRLLWIKHSPHDFDMNRLGYRFRYDVWVAIFLYALVTLLYCYPVLGSFSSAMLGPPEDNMLSYWNLWWFQDKVLTGNGTLTYTNHLYYPEGTSMYYHAWTFYNLGLASVLGVFFTPMAVYNIIVLSTFPLAGLGTFLLVKYITKNSYIALLGGFIFAFSPFHAARVLHHLNLSSLQFLPLFVLFFIKAIKGKGARNIVLAAIFMLLNTLCDWTYMIFCCYFVLMSYIYLAIRRKRLVLTDVISKSAAIVGSAIIVVSFWLWKMVSLAFQHPEVKGVGRTDYVADLLGYIVPGSLHWLGETGIISSINSSLAGNQWESATYLGVPALIVVLLASRKHLAVMARYILGALAFLTFTFGPELHILGLAIPVLLPDTVIALIPLLSNIRAPARYVVFVYLFWSVIAAMSAGILIHSVKKASIKRLLLVAVPLLFFADYYSVYHEKTKIVIPECYRLIPDTDEEFGILDLPRGYIAVNSYMLYQTGHGYPIVQGWASRKIGKTLIDRLDLVDLNVQRQQLTEARVKYIVLHEDLQIEDSIPPGPYREVYGLLYEDSSKVLLKVY